MRLLDSFHPKESRPSKARACVVMFTFRRYQNMILLALMMFSNEDMLRECVGGRGRCEILDLIIIINYQVSPVSPV